MGNVIEKTVGKQVTSYEYDLLGRTTAVITADGARTEYAYDGLGNRVSETDALGNVTEYVYDSISSLKEIVYADGSSVKAQYDLAGRMTGETDAEGNATHYGYDPVGRLTSVKDALGSVTEYEYDDNDNLSKVTDALGHVTEYSYEGGKLASETDALGNTVSYSYTPEGWLASETDGEGNVTRYGYDRTGNPVKKEYADGSVEEITYTPLGQLSVIKGEEGETLCLYDDGGRLISVQEPNGDTVRYTYDEYGNRTSMTYPDGKTTKYAYDELGRRVLTKGIKEDVAYTYDSVGNILNETVTGKYSTSLDYTYDKSGRISSVTKDGELTDSYVYDAIGQLKQWNDERYSYDAVGNMLTKGNIKYTYNAGNQLVSDGVDTYAYDKNGNLTQKGDIQYTYNARNLLESWTDGEYTETYAYNAHGLLKSITTPTETTSFVWDVLNGDGQMLSSTVNGVTTDYTYGIERISAQTKGSRTEFVYDGRGSVAAEVYSKLLSTDLTEKSYSPFGELLTENTSGFGYNGEYYNAATGMIYLRARFYAPEMNRFSQKDILEGHITDILSINRYLYCENDPVNFADVNGKEAIVVSGGDYSDSGEFLSEKPNSYNFINTSLRELQLLRENYSDEKVTWIISNAGWTDADKDSFERAVFGLDVNIQYINSADELTSYINNGSDTISRNTDKISYMSIFSHGFGNGTISLGYNYMDNKYNKDLDLTKEDVMKWKSSAFSPDSPLVESTIKLFSCKAFEDREKDGSIATSIAKQTGLATYGYYGKSDYAYTAYNVTKPNALKNLGEYLKWLTNSVSATYYFYNNNGMLTPSVFQPIASNYSNAYVAYSDGSVSQVSGIPDLASKKTTAYIQETPNTPIANMSSSSAKQLANGITNYVVSQTQARIANRINSAVNTVKQFANNTLNTIKNVYNTVNNWVKGLFNK